MPKSYHILYFPFIVKSNLGNVHFSKIINSQSKFSSWKRIVQDEISDINDEKMYYHNFVHNALYDSGGDMYDYTVSQSKNSIGLCNSVFHYERTDISSDTKFVIYSKGEVLYKLDIDKIVLDCYFTNVGILSIYLNNNNYISPHDILNINDYSRDLYNLIYDNISCDIEGLSSRKPYPSCNESNKEQRLLNKHIKLLLDDFFLELKFSKSDIEYFHIFDNKMFVNCCYLNTSLANRVERSNIDALSNNRFWQNFVEVDKGDDFGCQSEEMRKSLTQKNTYLRWMDYGTLYGITDRSFVCLTKENDSFSEYLLKHMQTIYSQMVKLVLLQRASLLSFSNELSNYNLHIGHSDTAEVISRMYCNYMIYVSKLYFKDVTSQVQGVELYEMFHKTFYIKFYIESFENQLSKTNLYFTSLEESKKKDSQNNFFNILAGLFLPATLITSILGMNNIFTDDDADRTFEWGEKVVTLYKEQYILHDLAIVIVMSIFFWLVMLIFNSTIKNIVLENKNTSFAIFLFAIIGLFICVFLSVGIL